MDFEISTEQRELKAAVRAFAREELNHDLERRDHEGCFPRECWQKCAEFGLLGLPVPSEFGGQSQDLVTTTIAMEALGWGCRDNGLVFSLNAQMWAVQMPLVHYGSDEQKRAWLPRLVSGKAIGAHAITEPGAGSDVFSLTSRAVRKDGGYVLNGQKTFITNAPYADTLVIYAKIDRGDGTPLPDRPIQPFVVERTDAGLSTSKPMRKMGMHSSPTGEVFLADCFVPADRLLGLQEKDVIGRASGRDVFHSERTGMAPMCVGIIERCLEVATDYAKQRITWGRPISEYQLVQDKLARMFMHLQNAENLMFKQLSLTAAGKTMTAAEASACKLYCARAATECAMDAVQVLGGNGYMQEYRVEMFARDAKLLQIGGGTDEIQIINIARHLLRAD